ncbi:unnamed protein product [Kluyveromyces dobzhanskii CBS 2104]|uniref:WGS project CCBQ000000000 data, contig 00009 n=1 Tax=Kluyveromyces dobzhanskii CBS 2104 TaxID=1427455 RepID=A0A0A8L397_9SACH|nr:unnamed protein product [Kluyveromyces dobzhanskii CBS 2104]
MTENDEDLRQKIKETYRYDGMSNQVLRADRSLMENKTDVVRDAEMSQPKSMAGKISVTDMGAAVKETQLEANERAAAEKDFAKRMKSSSPQQPDNTRLERTTVLDDITSLNYLPTDDRNTEIYDQIITWCSEFLGDDIPHSIIVDATDLIIVTLKQDEDLDLEAKKKKMDEYLDMKIDDGSFNLLVKLVRSISDYDSETTKATSIGNVVNPDEDDPELEEEEEQDEQNALMEAVEDGVEDEEFDEGAFTNAGYARSGNALAQNDIMSNTETLQLQSTSDTQKKISIKEVDEFYLQRKIRKHISSFEETKVQELANSIYSLLAEEISNAELPQALIGILGMEEKNLINLIVSNKDALYWGHILRRATDDTLDEIYRDLAQRGLSHLVEEYTEALPRDKRPLSSDVTTNAKRHKTFTNDDEPKVVQLDSFQFSQNSKFLSDVKISLPEDSFKRVKDSYEEVHIPPPKKADDNFPLVQIQNMPKWAQSAFPTSETTSLNRIQSEVYPTAFLSDNNILLCAPTGAGKTNVAMLTVLRAMVHYYQEEKNTFELKKFKVVYIAPLKALVQEQVREFQRRLHQFGVKVAELTGDSNLSKQQIAETQILVATPEKWDVITRKSTDTSFHKLVRLIIIDEVHLLHDERGPVIESIVARVLRDKTSEIPTRLVALSATLPNYTDVAKFLHVPDNGLFYFDSTFRPCPLAQQFCAITEKNTLKKKNAMNQACYDKLLEAAKEGHQVIIFVHSRKDTARTAKWLMQKLIDEDKSAAFLNADKGSTEILKTEANNASDRSLADLISHGFGIHHAGLTKDDRSLSEDLFADGLLKVLVSTATLAWGVNLPAHTVIIKGTELYSPEKGDWVMLPPQDILQMLGRAGRPRYDVNGEGIIITNKSDVRYYLAVLNQQLPIESQMITKVIDNLNAEVVLGNVTSLQDAVDWLDYSYLSVRMKTSPNAYNLQGYSGHMTDKELADVNRDIAHSSLLQLQSHGLVIYDTNSRMIQATELGRISSHFYISYSSISKYNQELTANSSLIDILRIFAMSEEFKNITVRQEERVELEKLTERCPIPIKEKATDPLAKSNVLLQVYISKLKLDGFALNSDMIYISQSGGRLLRALFEMCLRKGWPRLTKLLLTLCKCIDNRMWPTNSPFRQFKRCPQDIIKRAEASGLPWNDFLLLKNPVEVGEALRSPKNGKFAFDLLQRFPRVQISCAMQPVTNSLLRFQLEIQPSWIWDTDSKNFSESFLILVEDTDGERTIYQDTLHIGRSSGNHIVYLDFVVFLENKMLPPNYFVSVISEKWLNCEYKIPALLNEIKLPKQFPAPMAVSISSLKSVEELQIEEFSALYSFGYFNRVQSEVFDTLYHGTENSLVCATKGSGKTVMAELSLLNHWREGKGRAVYVCPSKNKITDLLKNWKKRFSHLAGGKSINAFTGNLQSDQKLLAQSHLILTTPQDFEHLSRRWPQRKNIQRIEMVIFDDIHEVGSEHIGACYEIIVTRMIFIATQLEKEIRIVGLGTPLANAKDFGEWLGAQKSSVFNFTATERPTPLKVDIETHNMTENPTSNKKALAEIIEMSCDVSSPANTTTVFVADRKQCVSFATELSNMAAAKEIDLLRTEDSSLRSYLNKVQDPSVKTLMQRGVGLLYEGMHHSDSNVIRKLHEYKVISILVASKDCAAEAPISSSVFIATTHSFDGKENRYVDYPVNSILEMIGTAYTDEDSKPSQAKLITTIQQKDYYKKFLCNGLPTESFMPYHVIDLLTVEFANETLDSKQDCVDLLTYTYLYRRIHANPCFYGLQDVTAEDISSYLTQLVEDALAPMEASDLITITDEEQESNSFVEDVVTANEACMIAVIHPVSCQTICHFSKSLSGALRLSNILEILSSSVEFQTLPIRLNDVKPLKRIYEVCPLKLSSNFDSQSVTSKVFVLLQAHLSDLQLPIDLSLDLAQILPKAVSLISTIIDMMSTNAYLNVTTAMDLCQMIVQGVWDTESPLKQIPFFDANILDKCKEHKVETVYDIMALEDEEREEIITLPENKLNKVAEFVNNYPNVEMKYSINTSTPTRSPEKTLITVTLARDEEPESLEVISKAFPYRRTEGWWIFVGDKSIRQLYAIKKVVLSKQSQDFELEITLEDPGDYELTLWCVCDSYLDADKEVTFPVKITE